MSENFMTYTGYLLILIFVSLIAWLTNREQNKSPSQNQIGEEIQTGEMGIFREIELHRNAKFGELSKGLFHDLMNPLSSLTLFVENLTTKPDNIYEAKGMLEKTVAASRRMESFMNSIKHATATASKDECCEADLSLELTTVYDLLAYKARMAGVEIQIKNIDQIILNINQYRLHQLLLNLLSNSLDACISKKEREKSMVIETQYFIKVRASRDTNQIQIAIEDNGCGIPKEKLADLFHNPFTTKSTGSGIGLITIKKIVDEELHGTISIDSRENEGTICTIAIPRTEPTLPEASLSRGSDERARGGKSSAIGVEF